MYSGLEFRPNRKRKSRLEMDTSMKPLIVECVGLPGAGKSTVTREVVKALSASGFRCLRGPKADTFEASPDHPRSRWAQPDRKRGRVSRILHNTAAHLHLFRFALATYIYLINAGRLERRSIRISRALLQAILGAGEVSSLVRAGYGDLSVTSQGFVAYLRQLVAIGGARSETELVALMRRLTEVLPQARLVLVVFCLDAETAALRVETRPKQLGPWDRMGLAERTEAMARQVPWMNRIIDALVTVGAVHNVLYVDATNSPDVCATAIVNHLVGLQTGVPTPRGSQNSLIQTNCRGIRSDLAPSPHPKSAH